MAAAVPWWWRSRGHALLDGGTMPLWPLTAEKGSIYTCAAIPQVICTRFKERSQTPRPVTVPGAIQDVGLLSHSLLHVISCQKDVFPVVVSFLRNIAQ